MDKLLDKSDKFRELQNQWTKSHRSLSWRHLLIFGPLSDGQVVTSRRWMFTPQKMRIILAGVRLLYDGDVIDIPVSPVPKTLHQKSLRCR